MPEPEERQRGRDAELQKRIVSLRDEIDHMSVEAPEQVRQVFMVINQMLSILSSENGTVMRILDRQDQAVEERRLMNERLFGKVPGDEDCMSAKVAQTYKALKSVRRVGMAVIIAVAISLATRWFEQTKLNEIIAAQKVQAAKP